MNIEQQVARVGALMEASRTNRPLRQRLRTDARAALQDQGLALPPGLEVVALEDTATVWHLVIPASRESELTDAELEAVSGGALLAIGLIGALTLAFGTSIGLSGTVLGLSIRDRHATTAFPGGLSMR